MLIKPILLTSALAFGLGQLTGAPPMKMGLWDETVVTDMSGANVPAFLAHHTTKLRVCVTPDSWAKGLAASNKNCERKNESLTGGHYSADLSCPRQTGHIDMNFSGEDTAHGTVQITMQGGMTVNSVTDMHFVSADCGSVTPDKPQMVH